jgi:hypothetical protein
MVFPNLLTQVSMLSYAGAVCGNCVVDPAVVTDPRAFRACFLEELEAMATEFGVDLGKGGLASVLPHGSAARLAVVDAALGIP